MFDGDVPETKPLTIKDDQAKGCCADGEKVDSTDRTMLVSKDGAIANVVVTLTVADAKVELPKEPIVMDQSKCRFEPHIAMVPAGATIAFLNSDSVSHNVHTYSVKNDPLNKTVAAGSKLEMKAEKEEAIKVACDIHPLNNLRVLQYIQGPLGCSKEAMIAWYNHWIAEGFAALERLLAGDPRTGRFCHGDSPGLADVCLVPQVFNSARHDLALAPYPTIRRIGAACEAIEAFRAAHPSRQPDAE